MEWSTIIAVSAGLAWYCGEHGLAIFLAAFAIGTAINEHSAERARAEQDRIEREEERAHRARMRL